MGDRRWTVEGERESQRWWMSGGWLVIIPALLILLLMLTVGGTVSAAPPPQEQSPTCQSCHPDQYDVWKGSTHAGASLDPAFQEQLAKVHNREECLTCHTTGVQTGSEKDMENGVTCQACHGVYQADHPASATMKLPMESSATCRTCHEAAFSGWEKSKHAEKRIECFDCHLAHSQGVRTGSVDTLCAACHSDQGTQAAHSRHGISGVNCTSCHMAKQMTSTAAGEAGAEISASSHSFQVAADVCGGCHGDTIHATGGGRAPGNLQVASVGNEGQPPSADEKGVAELRGEISALQKRLSSLRDVAVIGIGLAFGVGGFIGLMVGLVGMSLWKRSRRAV
jgi:Cytochrome c554 and c-prime